MEEPAKAELQWPSRPDLEPKKLVGRRTGQRFFSQKQSRRGLLKAGARVAVGTLAGLGAYRTVQQGREVASITKQVLEARRQKKLEGEPSAPKLPQSEKQQALLETAKKPSSFNLAFHNLTSEQHQHAGDKIRVFESVVASKERDLNVRRHEDLIRKSAKEAEIPENLFLGLVYYESGGDEFNISTDGAKGLTQVMDGTAENWAQKGFNFTNDENDDRYKPEVILQYSAKEINNEYERFGDWGLAFWAWHTGAPNVYDGLMIYFRDKKGELLPSYNVPVPDNATPEQKEQANVEAEKIKKLYKEKVIEDGVTYHHLFQNPEVLKHFSGREWDKTDEYVYKIVAAEKIYTANKELLPT